MATLQAPNVRDESFDKHYKRATSTYVNRSKRFVVPRTTSHKSYAVQYSHLYFARLAAMRPVLERAARQKWGSEYCVLKELKDLKVGVKSIIIGTIFKKLCLRPNILKEFSEKHKLTPQPTRAKYSTVNDELILEDAIQRVTLRGNISTSDTVSGVVVAVLGLELNNGQFEVDEVCFAGVPNTPTTSSLLTTDKYVMLVSGLNIGSAWCDQSSIQMFIDFVCGQTGGYKLCSLISRVIIVGDSLSDDLVMSDLNKENKVRFTARNYTANTVEAMTEFDQFLSQLSSSVSCDLMPGSHDPTNYQLPHQPLHQCMLPNNTSVERVTNPFECDIDGISFLGTSGEPINDIARCMEYPGEPIHLLESTLQWNHLAPTVPDTLGCYPFHENDPFIIKECPRVYFVGNQKSYDHKLIKDGSGDQDVLLVCVPSFDITHSAVIVNLRTLSTEEVCFCTSLTSRPNPHQQENCISIPTDVIMEYDSD